MAETVDVCIIGGGVIGLFTAMNIAKSGKTVRLIDKAFAGSSRNNIGNVLLHGHHEKTLPFMRLAASEWSKAAAEFGEDLGYEKRGSLDFAYNDEDLARITKEVEQDASHDIHTRLVTDLDELYQLAGETRLAEDIIAAKYSEEDGIVDTKEAMDGLRKLAIRAGVRIWGSDKVEEIITDGDKVLGCKTDSGEECQAAFTIVCAGVWGTKMLAEVGVKVPMRPARCHLVDIMPAGRMPTQMLSRKYQTGKILVKYKPRSGHALISYTGLMDQAQATWSHTVDEEAVYWMRQELAHFLEPLSQAKMLESHAVSLAVTPDLMPYLGKVEGKEGLMVAIGMNGTSYAYAPAIAETLNALVNDQPPPVDIEDFNPLRFAK